MYTLWPYFIGLHCQKNNVKKWAFGKAVYSGGSGDGRGWSYKGGGGGRLSIHQRSLNYLHTTWYKRHKRYWSCFDLFIVKFTEYYHPVVMSLWLFKNKIFLDQPTVMKTIEKYMLERVHYWVVPSLCCPQAVFKNHKYQCSNKQHC